MNNLLMQRLSARCAIEYEQIFNAPYCLSATLSSGNARRDNFIDTGVLHALIALDVSPEHYTSGQAVVLLFMYEKLLFYGEWRRRARASDDVLAQIAADAE
jgi:hypothetical protein